MMGNEMKDSVKYLVRNVKEAIQAAQGKLEQYNIVIDKIELEIKTSLTKGPGGELKFSVVPIEISGECSETDVQTVSMTMVPKVSKVELQGNIADELSNSLELINVAVGEAIRMQPVFELTDASITLNFGVSKEGQIKLFAKVGARHESTHSIKLTLKSKD